MRMALKEGRPVFSYLLVQPEAVKRDAFNEVRDEVTTDTGLPLYAGAPEDFGA